ncbi:MAG: response regulator [Nitrospirae bacterium]|nr:MAG: response regulator [Nitrospirota bacterium]
MSVKRNVLIVDDDAACREMVRSILDFSGFRVTTVENAISALGAIKHENFDVVITDYSMPGMKGTELTTLLRARYPDMLIIGMSGDDSGRAFLAAGTDGFLPKPLDFNDLISMVGTVSERDDGDPDIG